MMAIERTVTGAVLSQSCCDWLRRAGATRSTGHRATAARQVLHRAVRLLADLKAVPVHILATTWPWRLAHDVEDLGGARTNRNKNNPKAP